MIPDQRYFVSKRVGQAIAEYDMLRDGDRIMVAVSGGKDSLALLDLLRYRQGFVPIDFSVTAVYVDVGIPGFPLDELTGFFRKEGVDYRVERVEVLQGRNWDEMDCFTCSQLRRKALFTVADRLGFQKIATGHHMDDIAETILMNMFFKGEIGAMCPRQEFFDGRFVMIRPLAFLNAGDIERFVREENLFFIERHKCPRSEDSKRMLIRRLLNEMGPENPTIKKNILQSLRNIRKDYLP